MSVLHKAGIGVAYRRLYGAGEHLDEIERLKSHFALALLPMFHRFLIKKFAMKFRRDPYGDRNRSLLLESTRYIHHNLVEDSQYRSQRRCYYTFHIDRSQLANLHVGLIWLA